MMKYVDATKIPPGAGFRLDRFWGYYRMSSLKLSNATSLTF
jgi:hypothetical protein